MTEHINKKGREDPFGARLEIIDDDHTPSWQPPPAEGRATLELRHHRASGTLGLDVTEQAEKSKKETMMHLEKASATALRDWLNEQYPPEND